jgi:hypothetical protein
MVLDTPVVSLGSTRDQELRLSAKRPRLPSPPGTDNREIPPSSCTSERERGENLERGNLACPMNVPTSRDPPEERHALFERQAGICAVYGRDDVGRFTDHSSRMGKTRGLRDRTGHTALGMCSDRPKLWRAALR